MRLLNFQLDIHMLFRLSLIQGVGCRALPGGFTADHLQIGPGAAVLRKEVTASTYFSGWLD